MKLKIQPQNAQCVQLTLRLMMCSSRQTGTLTLCALIANLFAKGVMMWVPLMMISMMSMVTSGVIHVPAIVLIGASPASSITPMALLTL
jgi:hypothetical protein